MNRKISTKHIVLTALLAALTAVGSALRIQLPVAIGGTTAFHLGNIFCALSGLLLGPWYGGLAAGLGSFLYDILSNYIDESWITLLTKSVYGLVAGLIAGRGSCSYLRATLATAAAAICYAGLYLLKSILWGGMLKYGLPFPAAVLSVSTKLPATVFNAVVAVIFAPMLGIAIQKALKRNHLTLE